MYADLEKSLIKHLTGAVSGAQMFGTMETVDFASESAPGISVQVAWQGFSPDGRLRDVLQGNHQFAISVTVVGLRAKEAERVLVPKGLLEVHRRLISWRPNPDNPDDYPEIDQAGVAEQGAVWQYQINITLPRAVIQPEK